MPSSLGGNGCPRVWPLCNSAYCAPALGHSNVAYATSCTAKYNPTPTASEEVRTEVNTTYLILPLPRLRVGNLVILGNLMAGQCVGCGSRIDRVFIIWANLLNICSYLDSPPDSNNFPNPALTGTVRMARAVKSPSIFSSVLLEVVADMIILAARNNQVK